MLSSIQNSNITKLLNFSNCKPRKGLLFFFLCLILFNSSITFAAGEMPHFFIDLTVLFVASALIAYVSFRLGVTPIISFLIAGIIIGPNALGLVQNRELIDAAAEIGVILLLFTIGIEFSLEKLSKISKLIFISGGLQTSLTTLLTTGILMLCGIDWQAAIFTGFLVSLSSTAIVMKLLADKHETHTEPGQASLGILIFQDLAIVAMVLLIPFLGGEGKGVLSLIWALAKAVLIIAAVLLIARRLMPKVLEQVARTCSPEIFLLSVISICFGTAYITGLMGVSLSLGAFLAGLIVSESRFGQQAFSEILPLQIIFSAAFFISVGLLLDLQFLFANFPIILLCIFTILLLKTAITTFSVRVLGYSTGISLTSALILAQVGEFSFVLERAGREVGLTPMGLGELGAQTFIAATVVLMGFTPFLASLGQRFELSGSKQNLPQELAEQEISEDIEEAFAGLNNHVVIAGYGKTGQRLAEALNQTTIPFAIATLSPTGATEAESKNMLVVRGDYTKGHILNLIAIQRAKLIIVPDDQLDMAHRAISVMRANGTKATIVAFSAHSARNSELKEAGADIVISAEHAATKLIIWNVLNHMNISTQEIPHIINNINQGSDQNENYETNLIELSSKQLNNNKCNHTSQVNLVTSPSNAECTECIALGDTWVHLRLCMTCGHVGCCDSSKNRHASKHYETSKHPIIRSIEPNETWAWCFEDELTL